jgi:hypothetical protein
MAIQLAIIGQSGPQPIGAKMTEIKFNTEAKYELAQGGEAIVVDFDKLAKFPEVLGYIMRHGVKQMLGDAYSTHKGDHKEKMAKALKKLDSLYEGKAALERGGADAVGREMREMAEADVKTTVKAAGKKWADIAKETKAKVIAAQLAKNEAAYRKAAEAKLAIKPKVETSEDDDIMALLG